MNSRALARTLAALFLLTPGLAGTAELSPLGNLVANPSFEEDRDRDAAPDGWTGMPFDSPAHLTWDQTVARTGTRSLQIRNSFRRDSGPDWKTFTGRWVSARYPVRPGASYTLEVFARTREVTGHAGAHLSWQIGSKWLSESPTGRLTGTHDWQRLSVTAPAPANADSLLVSLNLARAQGAAWFDDVKVSGPGLPPPEVTYVFNETSAWFPFDFPLDDTNLDAVDLTALLDPPAGKHGFVTTRADGHFYFADGLRARFFGTNVGGRACAPPKDRAPGIAARLAKYGVNLLRLHSMDSLYGPLIDYSNKTSTGFNSETLDRVDFFVAELKKRGIYIYLDLLDYRQFQSADGVAHAAEFTHNWAGSMKGASIFDRRMLDLQKDYASKLLLHKNPYTGLRYTEEPAIAVVETTNENSIFYFFRTRDLSLPFYRDELTRRWNHWLLERYGSREKLAQAWTGPGQSEVLAQGEDPATGSVELPFGLLSQLRGSLDGTKPNPLLARPRVSDLLRFFAAIQAAYYSEMRAHLRDLGLRVPVAGTNQTFFPIDTQIDSMNDFMSRNQYWRHPHRDAKPFFKFANEPFVAVDLPSQRDPLSVIASTSVAGKPQAVAEFNFPWPNEFRCEGLLLSAAYACLQDWDLFLLFSYEPGDPRLSMFRSQSDPARWGTFPAAALLFHRQDVARARNEIHVFHSPESMFEPRPDSSESPFTEFRFLTFLSKVRNAFVSNPCEIKTEAALASGVSATTVKTADDSRLIRLPAEPWREWLYPAYAAAAQRLGLAGASRLDPAAKRFPSDTGELVLDYGSGLFTIRSPRTCAAIGRLGQADPIDLGPVRLRAETDFAAVTVTSLDGKPVGLSHRLLLTAVGRAENTGQGFWPPEPDKAGKSPMSWMLPAEGRPPVVVEPVRATVEIDLPSSQGAVRPLDPSGKRLPPLDAARTGKTVGIDLSNARSIWCEVEG